MLFFFEVIPGGPFLDVTLRHYSGSPRSGIAGRLIGKTIIELGKIMCASSPGDRQKNSNQDRKQKELRNEIMQPESSMDRGHFNSETH